MVLCDALGLALDGDAASCCVRRSADSAASASSKLKFALVESIMLIANSLGQLAL